MIVLMNYTFISTFILAFFVTNFAWAYSPTFNEPSLPYEVYTIEKNIVEKSEYLGDLVGDPHMYEFSVTEPTKLSMQVAQLQKDSSIPFSLIVIKENENKKGVKDVGRLKTPKEEWKPYYDKVIALELLRSDVFEADLDKGIYRIEVSTPDNFGKYMLVVGSEQNSDGFFKTISQVKATRSWFSVSAFGMFKSTYIKYPLGIVIILGLIYFTWRNYRVKNK